MSLGKIFLVCLFLVGFSDQAQSQGASKAQKSSVLGNRFSFGLAYLTFSESLEINDTVSKDIGFANYAGLAVLADHIWSKKRWLYQVGGGLASGKATAGGFVGINYSDAGRRAWTFTFLEFAAHYRMNSAISFGGGLIAGNRSADWESEVNPLIQSKQKNKVIYAPEFVIRWRVSRKLTLAQSIASPDFRGNTIWRWSTNFTL